MTFRIFTVLVAATFSLVSPTKSTAQDNALFRSWNQPFKPFRIIGNVYYVGANEIASFLITTSEGHVLLDGGFKETVPIIRNNIEQLGFDLSEIKILLNSHAHLDHAGGLARLKKLTGAQLLIMEGDVQSIQTGGKDAGPEFSFPPAKVDRILRDQETVKLGEVVLTAHLTPGHTKGNTTWTLQVTEDNKMYDVVFAGSPNVLPDTKLIDNPDYPNIASDYEKTFAVFRSLACDVFLGAHSSFFFMPQKAAALEAGSQHNPFIDPELYQRFVKRKERIFREKLHEQRSRTDN